ncbi:acetyl-CoA C-acyltransferase family protein [Pigmentiphaga aceris]|uniref:Acetyl-CoA C-acyltransferase family protein n=1 Tax=Pigmentiphaga aceris TaxID=1940612 RepID=A0A5C0B025_9BURK|nr:acetyl-CoA C-acyltransferase family protein [Pigmentiphaga aceris]QEI06191.1 acetyl-CoA C-acyltransferase family protein [Pigmentiphaga aceris]
MRDVVVVAGARTAIGSFGASLKDFTPSQLATIVTKEVLSRAGLGGDEVGHVVFGNVVQTDPRDMYLARVAAIDAGIAVHTPALTVNRLCGSGLQAIVSAAQGILLGEYDTAIAGGSEVMSRAPYHLPSHRFGARMGDTKVVDMLLGTLHDPFHGIHMGVTAENVAAENQITREDQDQLAFLSHRRAAAAIAAGYFKDQIVPISIKSRKGEVIFDTDENPRADISLEELAKLRAVFQKENGTVTAGNASSINDGAAAIVLMEAEEAKRRGSKVLGRLVGYAHAGVDPRTMGIGPVPATRKVLERTGIRLDQIDVIEANEAFAAQACAVTRQLGLDTAKVNPNGSGISLGHPVGATGAIVTVKALYELERIGGRYALVTMCIGGGQGIAAIFERA